MLIREDIAVVRKEFFELYRLLTKQLILKDDVISIGNLALFVDYSLHRHKWLEKKKQIQKFANQKDRNEVNMLLANYLYEIAIRLEISDNLSFKLKKMTSSYEEGKLRYFDIVLDPYEFPDWFKNLMVYLSIKNKKELYMTVSERLEAFPNFQKKGENISIAYFADKIYQDENKLERLAELEELVEKKSENEIAWFIATAIFGYAYKEMEKLNQKDEQRYALNQLREYKKRYEQNQLQTFDLFSDPMKEKLIQQLRRGT